MRSLKEKLVEYIANFENPLPIELLYQKFERYTKEAIDTAIEELFESGDIYEPRAMCVRVI